MEAFDRQRRNLIVISLAIIVYIAAGGDIQQGSIFGGTFTIEHKEVILWFGFIAYLYSLLRYWVYLPNVRNDLTIDFRKAQYRSLTYETIFRNNRPKTRNVAAHPHLRKDHNTWIINYLHTVNQTGGIDSLPYDSRDPPHEIVIRKDEIIAVLICIFFIQIFHEKHISEYVFPAIIAFVALVMILYLYILS